MVPRGGPSVTVTKGGRAPFEMGLKAPRGPGVLQPLWGFLSGGGALYSHANPENFLPFQLTFFLSAWA